jgi:alpha-L-rhamnosidase
MKGLEEFKNPSSKYRVKPFWFWNGDITEEGIDKQIREMYEKGIGGFFLSPRQGMRVPYLSEKWFSLVGYACDKAKSYGMEPWLYDEYPYPSGMGGGEVLKLHPEAEHKILGHECFEVEGLTQITKELGNGEILYAKAFEVTKEGKVNHTNSIDLTKFIGILQTEEIYQITGLTMYNNKRFFSYGPQNVLNVNLPEGKWKIEIFDQKPMGDFKFFGGYFDPCHKEAVETFLTITHDAYKKALSPELSEQVKGIFSDEVGMLSPIPWSDRLPEAFLERKSYSISEHLPAIFDSSWPNAYRIRYDLYDVIHQIFVDSFHKQVSDWCQKENIQYCTEVPFMRLSTQRYSDIPGGDTAHEKAGKSLEWIYDKYLCAFRYSANAVASLARQMGKEQCLIESFHSVGWSMTLQDAKWMLDRLAASGINLYVFHAFYYTMESITKHDAPPSHFYQNPYWEHYRKLADYAARLSVYVSKTKENCDIAVLDPVPSLWSLLGNPFQGFQYEGESDKERALCDKMRLNWVYTTKTLLLNQLQFNHLDSEMLPEFVVEDGRLLKGNATYRIVVVPPSMFFEMSAYEKLKEFVSAGGFMVFLGNLPYLSLEKEESDEEVERKWKELLINYPSQVSFFEEKGLLAESNVEEAFIQHIKELADNPVEVVFEEETERKNFITSLRTDEEGNIYLALANQGKTGATCRIINKREQIFAIEELSMEGGDIKESDILIQDTKFKLAPYESRYICLKKIANSLNNKEAQSDKQSNQVRIDTKTPFEVRVIDSNVYRLAEFEVSKDNTKWYPTVPMTFIEHVAELPLLENEDYVYQSTFGTPKHIHIKFPVTIVFRTNFQVENKPSAMKLLMDQRTIAGSYQIKVNGHELREEDFYHQFINDENNRLCSILDYVKIGTNEILITVTANKESDGLRDNLYLLGDFGVTQEQTLTSQPKEVIFDSNYIKGFPYYSGKMKLSRELNLVKEELSDEFEFVFDFKDNCLDCLELRINGISLEVRAFTPYVWKCKKEWVKEGNNHLELIRINTLANMLDGTYFDYDAHQLISIESLQN